MNIDKYISFIYKRLKGEITDSEQQELEQWASTASNREVLKSIEQTWEDSGGYEVDFEIDLDQDFELLQKRIRSEKSSAEKTAKIKTLPQKKIKPRILPAWAAAVLLMLAVGLYWYLNQSPDIEWQLATTQTAEEKEVLLADGSKVFLNENTVLEYPKDFNGKTRPIKLTGEAFFEVAKNPAKAFIISTEKAEVTVLGTSFTVRAIPTENKTTVVVKTGIVNLHPKNGSAAIDLEKGQTGVFEHHKNTLNKFSNKINAFAWQTNSLEFKDTPIKEIIEDLENTFHVNIILENQKMLSCKFFNFYKNANPNTILEDIAETFNMQLKKDANASYILSGGNCK